MSKNIFKLRDIDTSNIIYDDIIEYNNGNFLVSKIWIGEDEIKSLIVQSSYLKLYKYNETNMILIPNEHMINFLESIDELTYNFIHKNEIIKKYKLKNYTYKTLINELNDNDKVLRIRILNDKKPTLFFIASNKQKINQFEIKNRIDKIDCVKIIFEIDSFIIDTKNKIMFTNIIARHVLLHEIKLKPIKTELTEYSFLESDSDNDNHNKQLQDNEIILNTQTEYFDENNKDEKEDDELFNKNNLNNSNNSNSE